MPINTRQITVGTSPYTFTNEKGQERLGYWVPDENGNERLAVLNDTGRWQGVYQQDDDNYRSAGDVSFIPTQKIKDESGRETQLVVTPNGNHWDNGYKSAYHPEDTIEFINALTGGGLNNFSPTQWARRAYDGYKTLKGDMSGSDFANSWVNGNNGIVSDQFAEEHPYLSGAINAVGAYKGAKGFLRNAKTGVKEAAGQTAENYVKPAVDIAADASELAVKQEIPELTKEQILLAYDLAVRFHRARLTHPTWRDRAIRSGQFTEDEIGSLLKNLLDRLDKMQLKPLADLASELNLNINTAANNARARHWTLMKPKDNRLTINDIYHGVELLNTHIPYNEAVDEFVHELGHGITMGLGSSSENAATKGLSGARLFIESRMNPLVQRMVDYNASLLPTKSAEDVAKEGLRVNISEPYRQYLGKTTEKIARGYVGLRESNMLYHGLRQKGQNVTYDQVSDYLSSKIPNMTELKAIGGKSASRNFYRNMLGVTPLIGLSGAALSNQE